MRLQFFWPRLIAVLSLCSCLSGLQAQPLDVTRMPEGSLGWHAQVLAEDGPELSLDEARARWLQSSPPTGQSPVLSFGIGAKAQWVRLQFLNPAQQTQKLHLLVGTTWIDRIDAYLLAPGQPTATWHTGDETPGTPGVTPGLGFQQELGFAPGASELWLRVQSVDPMLFPIELLTPSQMVMLERRVHYGYGLLFGFLLALMAYNAMLYVGRRDRAHLLYAVYLISVVLLNVAYTGHGLAWLWPGQLGLQRYVILIAMVVFSACGLVFADWFLQLARFAPKLHKAVVAWCLTSLALMAALVVFDQHLAAAWFAFADVLAFTVAMVGLGSLTWRRGHMEARYFLGAAVCGMVGTATTAFAVLGWLPMTTATYHSLELGIALDAPLLALALAYQMRQQQQEGLHAIYLANHDPLTELHNRRGFLERARAAYSVAVRSDRPVAIVLLDLDHFKQINDQFGHEAGDQVLARSATLLASAGRAGDVLARWGGEEFILLLPDTDLSQAHAFAERLRQGFAELRVLHQQTTLQLTASFGVAQRYSHTTLEELIKLADQALYEAKRTGRNRVMASDPDSQMQTPLFQ